MRSPDAPLQEIDRRPAPVAVSTQALRKNWPMPSAPSLVFVPSNSTSVSSAPWQADSIRASPPAKPAHYQAIPKFPRVLCRPQKKASAPEHPASAPANQQNAFQSITFVPPRSKQSNSASTLN